MALTDEQIKDAIRQAGGIVHSDGNIFFTNLGMFQAAARAVESAVLAGMDKDAQRYRWLRDPGACGDTMVGVYRSAWDASHREWLTGSELDAALASVMSSTTPESQHD